jgi:hypothetical protein
MSEVDVCGWREWLNDKNHINAKLKNADASNLDHYLLIHHAATEAFFRRIVFVGLRLNKVTHKEADDWLFHNDKTPDKKFGENWFNKLYVSISNSVTWESVISQDQNLKELLEAWHDFAKIVRNHRSHGVRTYKDDHLLACIKINQLLLIQLDRKISDLFGGNSIAGELKKLSPRLPTGITGTDIKSILGLKRTNQPRPAMSLEKVKILLESQLAC